MRPISITMRAFGSYRKETTIDFKTLNQNLFLIYGGTGTGKTTIFDAITFALYGEGSGTVNKREGEIFQSRFTDNDVTPSVTFVFEESGKQYTITRTPKHFLRKKDGVSLMEKGATLSLIMPDGTEFPGKKTEIEKKIESLVGLEKEQFMQVGMIAQGDFLNIINAKTSDKKKAFRQLFKTEFYNDFIEELKKQEKELSDSVSKIASECAGIVTNVYIPADEEKYADLISMRSDIMDKSLARLDDFIDTLGGIISKIEADKKFVDGELADAHKKNEELAAKKAQAQELKNAFVALESAQKELSELASKEENVIANKKLADRILAACDVKVKDDAYQKSKKTLNDLQNKLDEQNKILPGLKSDAEKIQSEYEASDIRMKEETASFTLVENDYRSYTENYNNKLKFTKEAEKAKADLEAQKCKTEEKKKALSGFDEEYNSKLALKDELSKFITIKAQKVNEQTVNKNISERISKASENQNKIARNDKEISKRQEEYLKLSDAADKAAEKYKNIKRLQDNARAGIIARDFLKPDCPCPVCGSLSHPSPCVIEDEAAVNMDLDKLFEESQTANGRKESAVSALESLINSNKEMTESYEADIKSIKETMLEAGYDVTPNTLPDTMDELVADKLGKLSEEIMVLGQKEKELEAVTSFLNTADKRKADLQDAFEKASAEILSFEKQVSEKTAAANSIELKFESSEAASKTYNDAKTKMQSVSDAFNKVQTERDRINAELNKTNTLIKDYGERISNLESECEKAAASYKTVLTEKNMTEDEYKEIISTHTKSQADGFIIEFNSYNEKKSRLEGSIEAAKKSTEGKEMPDVASIDEQISENQKQIDSLKTKSDEISGYLSTDRNVSESLQKKRSQNIELVAKSEKYTALYNRFSGKTTGFRMDLETYVQRYYLNNILGCANRRYAAMTNGEYELRMMDIEDAGDGANRGLDLQSYSHITGKSNAIGSLSGGESFMAALSLAIGMADQIAMSTNVNLDMMFIDEGFGSLSKESRDKVIQILKELAGGNRLVGMISHVSELMSEIDSKLVVTRDDNGSHIKWELS